MSFADVSISHLSTQYVLVPMAARKSGASYNPTSDPVKFAFAPYPAYSPAPADWVTGSWDTVSGGLIYPYNAKCLIGPSGSTALTQGDYIIYVQVTDNPEVPVLVAGTMTIT